MLDELLARPRMLAVCETLDELLGRRLANQSKFLRKATVELPNDLPAFRVIRSLVCLGKVFPVIVHDPSRRNCLGSFSHRQLRDWSTLPPPSAGRCGGERELDTPAHDHSGT